MLVFAAALVGMLLYDALSLRGKMTPRGKLLYGLIVCASLYAGIDYVMAWDAIDYLDVMTLPFKSAAEAIEATLKTNWDR
ncbi:hypothetical protein [Paenibacillus soyae]|uniref:Uncharacterized protein n=1 Tax=Paenibacillus soyae TaxID=2969249 RepID=A0A9X2MR12_9BACL|nr:hypothetical protein [Paenibacillus soyae]MCR2804599.1 hypothetical protein [Paenibacillus soyae]